jgi:hypothetical protein
MTPHQREQWRTVAETQSMMTMQFLLIAYAPTWLRDEEVVGSNPATPTVEQQVRGQFRSSRNWPLDRSRVKID